jgi:cytochrome P450
LPAPGPLPLAFPFPPPRGLLCCPEYRQLRATQPVCRVRLPYGADAWLVTRHAEAVTVLGGPRFSRAATVGMDLPRETPEPLERTGISVLDPPEHSRIRSLAARAFTPRRIAELRPQVERCSDRLLAAMKASGKPADLVSCYARPMPLQLVSELRCIPPADLHKLQAWSDAIAAGTSMPAAKRQRLEADMVDYATALIAARRARPGSDLVSALITVRDGGRESGAQLTESELVELTIGVLVAGLDTVSNQLANFAFMLLTDDAQWQALRASPGLVPAAVEELLRFIPFDTGTMLPRVAIQPTTLAGQQISEGDVLLIAAESANRDERVFEDGERLVFGRDSNPHLGFGYGPHYCLGAHLARLQLQVAVEHWLELLPRLRLAVPPERIEWRRDQLVRGPVALPVSW